jgi:hypothetical protein
MKAAWALLLLSVTPLSAAQKTYSPEALHRQLIQLQSVVGHCAASKTKKACNPAGAADDAVVMLPTGPRAVDFEWLRFVLADAPTSKTGGNQLKAASLRLDQELAELSTPPALNSATVRQEQTILRGILAGGEFPKPQPPTFWQRLWGRFSAWLSRKLQGMAGNGSGHQWVAPILLLVLLLAASGALLWWFTRTRRSRILLPAMQRRMSSDPHARREQDWEAWMQEARQFAEQRQWRESIHRIYWAAISRLESRGVWRADRARTPREYLELMDTESARRTDLLELTRSLESFWYGGRPAAEQDYVRACALFERVTTA